jgi:hypothetical protein
MELIPLQLPWLAFAETRFTAAGNASIIVTPVAGEGP